MHILISTKRNSGMKIMHDYTDISVFFRETMMSNDVHVYIPRRTATNDE